LRRINGITTSIVEPIDMDSYYIKLIEVYMEMIEVEMLQLQVLLNFHLMILDCLVGNNVTSSQNIII
jgi:hypothetical protein